MAAIMQTSHWVDDMPRGAADEESDIEAEYSGDLLQRKHQDAGGDWMGRCFAGGLPTSGLGEVKLFFRSTGNGGGGGIAVGYAKVRFALSERAREARSCVRTRCFAGVLIPPLALGWIRFYR
jgi:hypothetical protein